MSGRGHDEIDRVDELLVLLLEESESMVSPSSDWREGVRAGLQQAREMVALVRSRA